MVQLVVYIIIVLQFPYSGEIILSLEAAIFSGPGDNIPSIPDVRNVTSAHAT